MRALLRRGREARFGVVRFTRERRGRTRFHRPGDGWEGILAGRSIRDEFVAGRECDEQAGGEHDRVLDDVAGTDRAGAELSELWRVLRPSWLPIAQADTLANFFGPLQIARSIGAEHINQHLVKVRYRVQFLNDPPSKEEEKINFKRSGSQLSNAECPRFSRKAVCEASEEVRHVFIVLVNA